MIVVVPPLTAATAPVADPTVAMAVLLLIQVPPVVLFVSVVEAPSQRTNVPAIAAGLELTVATVVRLHPVASVYVMFDVPAATPVSVPLEEPIVATATSLLLHVPPEGVALNVVVIPIQVNDVPPITDGRALTVTSFVD